MKFEIKEKKENFLVSYCKISWQYSGADFYLEFDHHVNVYDIDEINGFLVDDDEPYFISYDKDNKKNIDTFIDKDMQFRYIKRSNKSKCGYALVYYPMDDKYRNEWGDMVQFELNLDEFSVGDRLGIVR